MSSKIQEAITQVGIFSFLDQKYIDELVVISRIKEYSREQIVFFEGDVPKDLLIILDGKVSVYQTKENGTETVINIFYDNEIFAEAPCFNSFNYPASAKCLSECKILHINYAKFKDSFLKNPDVALQLISGLSQKIKKLSRFISNANKTAVQKVAEYMLYNDISKIKNKDLASRLNIRPETLSRTITKMQKDGVFYDKQKLIDLL